MVGREYRNWAELPPELISSILLRLGAIEILKSAQRVCRSWRRLCKDPSMWRKIDIYNCGYSESIKCNMETICRHAVDRSQGGLVEISLWYFCTDSLLSYIAQRSSNLRCLRLVRCDLVTDEGFVEAVVKLPLLEDLELSYCKLSHESLKVAGQSCPNMKTLKLNCASCKDLWKHSDHEALAIAENMPRLHHLQLVQNRLTDIGLNAILNKCTNLKHLNLRQCSNVNLVGDLEKQRA